MGGNSTTTMTPDAFVPFGSIHGWTVAGTVASAIVLPWVAKRFLSRQQQLGAGLLLGGVVAASYLGWVGLAVRAGEFRWQTHLPLHLCWLANLLMPLVMLDRWQRLGEVVYYWGIAAGLQATVTPTVSTMFPEWEYIRYVVAHNGMVVALIYAIVVHGLRPTLSGVIVAMVSGNVLLVAAVAINLWFDANYLFLCEKPRGETLLTFMGPWPVYILAGELLAAAHFLVAWIPFGVVARLRRRRAETESRREPSRSTAEPVSVATDGQTSTASH